MGIDPAAVEKWKATDEESVQALLTIVQDVLIPMLIPPPDLPETGGRVPTMTDSNEAALTGFGR